MEKMQKRVRPVPLTTSVQRWLSLTSPILHDAIVERAADTSPEVAIVERARDLIANVGHWSRFKLATDNHDQSVDWGSPRAEKFCAVGALQRAAFELTGNVEQALAAAQHVQESMFGPSQTETLTKLMTINDSDGHAAVLDQFDATLHKLRTGDENHD